MSTSTTIIEVVKFTEKGVDEIVAQTKVMNRETDNAVKRYTTLVGLVNNPAFVRHAVFLEKTAKSHELINMRLRNQVYAQRLADGSETRRLRAVERMNREYASMQRRAEFTAKYGDRLGGFFARHGGKLSAIGGMVGGAAGTVTGMARQGFEGTVEAARLSSEMQQISRELAGAFKPVVDVATKFAKAVRQRLEKTGEGGQNAIMAAGLVGSAGAGLVAFRAVASTIGMVAGETMATRFRGMAVRGAAGVAGAGLLSYGVAAGNTTSGALGGAMLGFSVGGPVGAAVGAGVGAATARAQGLPNARAGETSQAYFKRRRAEGASWFGAALDMTSEGISQTWHWATKGGSGNWTDERAAAHERRSVQLSGGGVEDMDSYYTRLTSAVEKREGERELTGAMRELAEELRRRNANLNRPGGGT